MEVGWLHVPTKMLTATGLHASKGRPVGFATYVPLKLSTKSPILPNKQTNKNNKRTGICQIGNVSRKKSGHYLVHMMRYRL